MPGSKKLLSPPMMAILIALVSHGCAAHPKFIAEDNPETVAKMRRLIRSARLESLESTHRAILSVGKREYAMTGHVVMGPDQTTLVAISDLGTTLFQATKDSEGVKVDRPASGFDTRVIHAVMKDIDIIYRSLPAEDAELKWGPSRGAFVLKGVFHPSRVYIFDRKTGAITDYYEFSLGRKSYEAHLRGHYSLPGSPAMLPRRVTITSRRGRYKLELSVLEPDPAERSVNAGK